MVHIIVKSWFVFQILSFLFTVRIKLYHYSTFLSDIDLQLCHINTLKFISKHVKRSSNRFCNFYYTYSQSVYFEIYSLSFFGKNMVIKKKQLCNNRPTAHLFACVQIYNTSILYACIEKGNIIIIIHFSISSVLNNVECRLSPLIHKLQT